jgi:hypothetical protein
MRGKYGRRQLDREFEAILSVDIYAPPAVNSVEEI